MPPLPIHSVDENGGVLGSLDSSAHGGLLGPLTSPLGHLGSAAPWDAAYAYLHGSSPVIAGRDALALTAPVPAQDAITQPTTDPVSLAQSSQLRKTPNLNPSAAQAFKDDIEPSTLVQTLSDLVPDNYWMPGEDYAGGGHHEFPRAHYKRMPPETQKVFDAAKSGPLFVIVNGRRHEFDRFHRQ